MVEIIPAILPQNFNELQSGLEKLRGVAPLVQVDIVRSDLLQGQEAMPLWEEFDFEFDIMVPEPEPLVLSVVALGASRVVVHAAASGAREALERLQETREGEYAILVGVALRAHDTPEALEELVGLYDYVQVMGIDHEGKQGEPPDPHGHELILIRALRAKFPELCIQVDGASAAHPRELLEAGANRLVVGSVIVRSSDPKAALKALYTEANAQ